MSHPVAMMNPVTGARLASPSWVDGQERGPASYESVLRSACPDISTTDPRQRMMADWHGRAGAYAAVHFINYPEANSNSIANAAGPAKHRNPSKNDLPRRPRVSAPKNTPYAASADPPNRFMDPIKLVVMRDPVQCRDGHNFDRKSIVEYLQYGRSGRRVCPMDNKTTVQEKNLVPNRALKEEIEEWLDAHPDYLSD
ncbi:U-box domain-containing protein 4 [Diplonema papillatum]|nr:U-box domain-containing protein 4 [Diplonema papillatum]